MTTGGSRDLVGQVKQRTLRVYNSVNQQVSGVGVREVRADFLGPRILITARHHRIPALKVLDEDRRDLTRSVDIAVIDAFKALLVRELSEELGVPVVSVLKDYDPATEIAFTLIVFERDPLEA